MMIDPLPEPVLSEAVLPESKFPQIWREYKGHPHSRYLIFAFELSHTLSTAGIKDLIRRHQWLLFEGEVVNEEAQEYYVLVHAPVWFQEQVEPGTKIAGWPLLRVTPVNFSQMSN